MTAASASPGVAAGGVAPVPIRLGAVEEALAGAAVEEVVLEQAAAQAVRHACPIPQASYKLGLLRNVVLNVLESAVFGPGPSEAAFGEMPL